jgi:transposase
METKSAASYEERKEIGQWYLDNGKNFRKTAARFYRPIYSIRIWVQWFEKYGDKGLRELSNPDWYKKSSRSRSG